MASGGASTDGAAPRYGIGQLKGSWSTSENNHWGRYYTLMAAGRRRLATGQTSWEWVVTAMMRVLRTEAT